MRRSIARLSLPFRDPFVTASGVVSARELLLLRLEDDDGAVGFGEAAPFEPYDGVSLEEETVQWCREMLALSPFALRLLKASFNATDDGLSGIQQLAHDTNLLFYMSEEAQEGRDAYREKRKPDFGRFPKRP